MVADLTAVALVALVLVLVAYLRMRAPATAGDGAAASHSGEPARAPGRTHPAGSDAGIAALPARDLEDALRITGGSLDIAEALLEQMLAELPAQIDALTAAAAGGDWPAAARAADGVRGSTTACAVPALHAAACRLLATVRAEDVSAVAAALAEVERERRRLLTLGHGRAPASVPAQARGP